ncbi:hypothetical protein AYK26_01295 [Euryarchaeota archaeon SM23-78]|nr:MAG: hypothetical protein AYK26_01295 [Euryarchaeota archaeon SM23-78]MBW3000632.1 hypothetical protein [Candidatus Woesearchaeota archaeon]
MAKKRGRASKKRRKPTRRASKKRKEEEMGRAQVWSVDVLLAVVIFISVLLIFYVTMNRNQEGGLQTLEPQAEQLKTQLEQNHEYGFVIGDDIDEKKFKAFADNTSTEDLYKELKKKLGVTGEFCIYFEDADGNLLILNTSKGNKTGLGDSDVIVGGTPCGQPIP